MVEKEKGKEPTPVIRLPYPQRPKKKDNREKNFEKLLVMFKKL